MLQIHYQNTLQSWLIKENTIENSYKLARLTLWLCEIVFKSLSTWNKCLLKIFNFVNRSFYEKKKGPNAFIMFSEDTDFTPIFYRWYFFFHTELELVESYSELGTLWLLIPWTTFSGWYSHGYALKSAKICFHSLKYLFISLNLIAKRCF